MSYIVKNCPCYTLKGGYYDCWANQDTWCENITDCVIKQVIEKCTERSGKCERCKASEDYQPTDCLDYCGNDDVIFATKILQLFDIEEINE